MTREAAAFHPDAVLVGAHPERVEMITRLTEQGSTCVVLVDGDDRIATAECVFVGAMGVAEMTGGFAELADQLDRLVAGNRVLPVDVERDLISDLLDHRRRSSDGHTPFERLTRRECQILGELMRGASASDIAATAYLSIATVRSHIQQILRKLDVRSQTSAVALAYRSGWEPPGEARRPTRAASTTSSH
ncbi:MAG: response regulator transcription factor [Actinomycetota bacterium]|nr:response regulator transcription factor [Actinomycetota bacterium]